jgi:hypothetical protein
MADKINENGLELSRLLTLAGLQPTLIVMPSTSPTKDVAEDEVEDEIETDAEMQHSDAALVNPSAFTPSKRAKRKFKWVSARQGDNPLDEKQIEETAQRLQTEYTEFKNDK